MMIMISVLTDRTRISHTTLHLAQLFIKTNPFPMKLRSIIAIIFIALLAFGTVVEAKGSSSRSSSSSSRSSSSSSYSKSYSSSSSKPSTSTSTYTKTYTSTPTTTATPKPAATSTYTKTYTSTPTPSPTSTKSTSYGGTTTKQTQTMPNPNFTPPTRQTATHTTVVNNRTVIYSQGAGGNGSTFMDSMIGTMAGMAIYDMITDDKGNQVKVEPYYVSGEQRIPV